MNTKTLIGLIAAAALVVAAAFWATSGRAPSTSPNRDTLLVPSLEGKINEVTAIALAGAGEKPVATLKREEKTWTVAQKDGYPANVRKVRELLLGLAEARLLEAKTVKPELYPRLGVQDISAEDAPGVEVTLEGLGETVDIIIGDTAPGGGTFMRRADEAQSWLVNGSLIPAKEIREWLNPDLLDIPADRIQLVRIAHTDGEVVEAFKQSRSQPNFTVLNVPAGRALKSESVANSLASALSALGLEDVVATSTLNPADHPGVETEYRTFDGLTIAVKAFDVEGTHYVHFGVSADENQALRFAESAQKQSSEEANTSAPTATQDDSKIAVNPTHTPRAKPADPVDFDTTRAEAQSLNARLNPWVFNITEFKYTSMTERMASLLTPEKTEPDVPEMPDDVPAQPAPKPEPSPAQAPTSTESVAPVAGSE